MGRAEEREREREREKRSGRREESRLVPVPKQTKASKPSVLMLLQEVALEVLLLREEEERAPLASSRLRRQTRRATGRTGRLRTRAALLQTAVVTRKSTK